MSLRRTVLVEVGVFFSLGLLAIYEGIHLVIDRNPNVVYDMLGPGYYIVFIGILLTLLGISHLVINYKKALNSKSEAAHNAINIAVFGTVGALAIYILLLTNMGYISASFVFLMLEFRVLGEKSWLTNGFISFSITAIFYVVFVYICGMIFPRGLLF
jgi:hypothetical protein